MQQMFNYRHYVFMFTKCLPKIVENNKLMLFMRQRVRGTFGYLVRSELLVDDDFVRIPGYRWSCGLNMPRFLLLFSLYSIYLSK